MALLPPAPHPCWQVLVIAFDWSTRRPCSAAAWRRRPGHGHSSPNLPHPQQHEAFSISIENEQVDAVPRSW